MVLTRVRNYLSKAAARFWFTPGLMAALGAALAFGMAALDAELVRVGLAPSAPLVLTGGAEAARDMLSTVAGAMVSVVSVTFSVTMVALTLTSTQFGPRLLNNFLRDAASQRCLGMFLLTYLYCLLALRGISAESVLAAPGEAPRMTTAVGLALGVGSVFVLVYFIHHIATSIKAERVTALVADELTSGVARLYPDPWEEAAPGPALPQNFMRESAAVLAKTSGYVQALDAERLYQLAESRSLVLVLQARPGDFVMAGGRLAMAWPLPVQDPDLDAAVNRALVVGVERTRYQDLEYSILQLVEVALRALSPGVNDPHTAMGCLDRLGASMADLAGRTMDPGYRVNADGRLRLVAKPFTYAGAVGACFNQIRQAAANSPAVSMRLLEVLTAVAEVTPSIQQQKPLLAQGRMVMAALEQTLGAPQDLEDARERFAALRRVTHRSL